MTPTQTQPPANTNANAANAAKAAAPARPLVAALALLTLSLTTATAPAAPTPATTRATAVPATSPATAPVRLRGALWAFGSADQYWIAISFLPKDAPKDNSAASNKFNTVVRAQSLPGGDWRELGVVAGHVIGVAESAGDLAL